ncbi:hypothetical protein Q7P36_008730 [Cladosporium allicinum]
MTIPWWELERYRQDNLFIGPFKKWLGELLECASLEEVTIELTAQKQDRDKIDQEIVENWEIVKLSPEEDPMAHQPDITDSQRDRD